MEGELFEVDVRSLAVRQLFDLARELELPAGAQPHFKAGFTAQGRVIVANNTYDNHEFMGLRAAGRLAEWDGSAWRIVERSPFYEVHGRRRMGGLIYAVGWDRASVLLKTLVAGGWETYRLPKASQNFDHMWQDEWPRIREVEHERFLMDAHGQFYELSPHAWGGASVAQKIETEVFPTATADAGPGGRIWGVRPISRHLAVVSDFCNFRGMLVAGTNQVSPFNGDNVLAAEPDSGVWIGRTDDLWRCGKPAGWGGPWWDAEVVGGQALGPVPDDRLRAQVPAPAPQGGPHRALLGRGRLSRRRELGALCRGRGAARRLRLPRVPRRLQRALGEGDRERRMSGDGVLHLYMSAADPPPRGSVAR